MPRDAREPQSYGSEKDWVTGRTGSKVNDPEANPPASQEDFYENERETHGSAPHQGGDTSPLQIAESRQPAGGATESDEQPVSRVTDHDAGAKRESFFRKRDYE
jgi:hypothetical protein